MFKSYLDGKLKETKLIGNELRARCPFHDDESASFSINIKSGLWKCFAGCGEGNMAAFKEKYDEVHTPIVPEKEVAAAHKALLANSEIMKILLEKRGITLATVEKFAIGWDGDRLWIPIYQGGKCLNVRKYDLLKRGKGGMKVLSYGEGFGKTRIYPFPNLMKADIFLFEGEMDALLANTLGINGVTATCGAGTFPDEYLKYFHGKSIGICYDNDKAGIEGAQKVAKKLRQIAKELAIIALPVKEDKEDFTDYIIKYKKTAKDFMTLCAETAPIKIEKPVTAPVAKEEPTFVALDEAARSKYYFKHIAMNVLVSGKDLAPYFVPKKIRVTCPNSMKKCAVCPMFNKSEEFITYSQDQAELLSMIDCSVDQQTGIIKKKLGVVNCHALTVEVQEVYNIEEVRVIPEIDFSAEHREYVTRQIFCVGDSIHTNKSYRLTGVTVPNPQSQYATHIVYDKQPIQASIENFKLDTADKKELKVFQPVKGQTIQQKLFDIYRDFTYNVTNIYGREDILCAMDLVYHSVIGFKFMRKDVTRGWSECLIIGDTRSGKTESVSAMIKHYRAGELCTGENTSFAGLVGGMQQNQDKWSISWGKIPLNDRRLVVIDEVSGIPLDQLSNMSGIRSSGVAEIVKIQTERTHARTRLIWLSNPRSGRRLDTYNYGVLAVKELIGRVEDIARFDIAVSCASEEVPTADIHRAKLPKVDHNYTSDLCHKLIMWGWSRRSENIKFLPETDDEILKASQELGGQYSSSIPLVESAEQRIKLARLSAALAVRLFSTENGEDVIVRPEHVRFVCFFLRAAYDKPSMGYNTYSKTQMSSENLDENRYAELKYGFMQFSAYQDLITLLLEYQIFRKSEFIDQSGLSVDEAKVFLKWCSQHKLIKTTSNGYFKSPVFTAFLKRLASDTDDAPTTAPKPSKSTIKENF